MPNPPSVDMNDPSSDNDSSDEQDFDSLCSESDRVCYAVEDVRYVVVSAEDCLRLQARLAACMLPACCLHGSCCT